MSNPQKTRYGILIDYEYCTGCHSCEVACKQEHDLPVGKWGVKVFEFIQGIYGGRLYITYIPIFTELCNLCKGRIERGEEPACVKHCMAKCMAFGTIEELSKKLQEKARQVLWVPK